MARTRFGPGCICRLVVPPDTRCLSVVVHDVSRNGVGLILCEPLHSGTVVAIRPQGLTQPGRVISLQVQHATQLPDGRWLLGCSHAEDLAPSKVRVLLSAMRASRE
jgi:hypothetical protein